MTLALLASGGSQVPAAKARVCAPGWMDDRPSPPTAPRAVAPEDLIALRDIGNEMALPNEPMFSISPDGKHAALQLRRADAVANTYCLAMIILDLEGKAKPAVVDHGGDALRWRFANLLGKADFPNGVPQVQTPIWSADSRSIYFLKKAGAAVQIWEAQRNGSRSVALTDSAIDVAKFARRADGTIIFATRTGSAAARDALAQEALIGYRFDARYSPMASAVPFPRGPLPLSYFVFDRQRSVARAATKADQDWLDTHDQQTDTPFGGVGPRSDSGPGTIWAEPIDTTRFPATTALAARDRAGVRRRCAHKACEDPYPNAYWWAADKRSILFMRREGWAREAMALYRWSPASNRIGRLFSSTDEFSSCQLAGVRLICVHEAALQPRRVVAIDPTTGRMTELYSPNRDYAQLRSGKVERMRWRTEDVEVFSDLIYPLDYRPGTRYPLVVVQYWSHGFLRGGTGDDYPIQSFAGRGYFVLSYHSPEPPNAADNVRDIANRERAALKDFAGRRFKLEALEVALKKLIASGQVDPERIGITGLSEGTSTIQFAGLNSKMFRAAAMSSCCWEPTNDAILGPSIAALYHKAGYPRLIDDDPALWARLSWQRSPARVAFPVLMQLNDREYLAGVNSYTALRQAGRPAALYVFPDEDHIKFQPAHRLANYRRSLAWFDFWLRPERPPRDEDRTFVSDWLELRQKP